MWKKTKAESVLWTKDTAQHGGIHHHVKWEKCAAKIISARWRKAKAGVEK